MDLSFAGPLYDVPYIAFKNTETEAHKTMHINNIERLFSENRNKFKETVDKIDSTLFNGKQSEDKWSVSEHCHHIILVKRKILHIIKDLSRCIEKRKEISVTDVPVRKGFKKITYDKMPDFPIQGTEPSNAFSKEQLCEMMGNACMEMDGCFSDGRKYDCSSIKADHPVIGSMNYYEWFFFEGMHAKGHLDHIRSEYFTKE